jgi:Flp pilus assembly protein TadG
MRDSLPTKERVMKRVVLCLLLFAIVIASWAVFARQRRTQITAAAQTTTSTESRPATSDRQVVELCNK